MVIDNTAPTVKFDKKYGIHELSSSDLTTENYDGQDYKAFWVHGEIYDDTIDYLKSRGHDISQEANTVYAYQDSFWPTAQFFPTANGDFKFGVLPEEYANYPTNVAIYTYDYATTGNPIFPNFTFINKGDKYSTIKTNTEGVSLGSDFTNTFMVHNAKELTSATVTIDIQKFYKIVDVKPSKQLDDLAKENNWTIRVAKPQITDNYWSEILTFAVDILDKKTNLPVSINGDINLLDITLKVIDDHNYFVESGFNYKESSYQTSSGSKFTLPTFADRFKFISQHSMLEGYYHGEAVNFENYELDYSKIGTKAYLVDKKGKKYSADISKNGYMTITDIPATKDEYTLVVDIRGHFQYNKKLTLSKTIDGKVQGIFYIVYTDTAAAGDVNGDNVIDIYDAKLIANNAGNSGDKLKEDLNKDGIVDIVDFNYVEKNFMTVNPYIPTSKKPVEKTEKLTLEELKKSFN